VKRLQLTEGLQNSLRQKGWRETIAFVKSSRQAVLRSLTGSPLPSLDGVPLTPKGWPVWLRAFRVDISTPELFAKNRDKVRCLLTLLNTMRYFYLKAVLDVSTIASPYAGGPLDITAEEHKLVCEWLKIRPSLCHWSKFHMTTKSGPMGKALESAVYELPLLGPILPDIKEVGGPALHSWISHFSRTIPVGGREVSLLSLLPTCDRVKSLRRLVAFSDKEGKTRIIGICDY